MINILRKNQKGLWIVIAMLCIPFVFYFSNSRVGPVGNNQFGKIYGRPISTVEFQRSSRLFMLARDLGMYLFLQDMVAGANSENEAHAEFTWNRLILQHEAERLGIQPTMEEVATVVKGLRPFAGKSGFDVEKYNEFTQTVLPTMGFSDAEIEELAGDQLTLQKLKTLIGSGVRISESESRENYDHAYGKLNVSVIRLRSEDLAKEVNVTDDDIAKYYDAHKTELKSEEKRKVSFVTFGLDEEQKKLAGRERVEALQKVADRANDFTQALLEKGANFNQIAGKFQLPVQVTGEFMQSAPDPLLIGNQQLASTAFELTPEEANSDAVQAGDAFYILHLDGMDPAKPLTLEEARPKIVEAVKSERVRELVSTKGAELAHKIREAVKAGAPIEAAVQQAGVPAEKLPPFALSDGATMKAQPGEQPHPEEAPDQQTVKAAVAEMEPGAVSELLPTPTGGVVAILEKRDAPPPELTQLAKPMFDSQVTRGKQQLAFYEWLQERRREAGLKAVDT